MRTWRLALFPLFTILAFIWQPPSCFADQCPTCNGKRTIQCPNCDGTGIAEWTTIHGQRAAYGCERCGGVRGDPMQGTGRQGSGYITCPTCGGAGQVQQGQAPADTQAPSPDERAKKQRALEEQEKKQQEEVKRKREEFEKAKQNALKSMKGITENELGLKGVGTSDALGLKSVGQTKTGDPGLKGIGDSGQLPPEDQVTNPQIARIMRGLRTIQVPSPLSQKDVSLSWEKVSLRKDSGDAMLWVADVGLLVWDVAGHVGDKVLLPYCRALLIVGKVLIAGEDGAYVHLVTQDKVYENALRYLKDPATSRRFAELVRDLKEGNSAAGPADADMVRAARAIIDPSLGSSGKRIALDAMLSPEAKAAMVRSACIELGAELVGTGTEGLLRDLTRRKELYEAARLNREEARRMLRATPDNPLDALDRDQLKKVIAYSNHVLEDIYRLEMAGPRIGGFLESVYVSREVEEASGKSQGKD